MAGKSTAWYRKDATPGYALAVSAVISFLILNSPFGAAFDHLLHDKWAMLALGGERALYLNSHVLINDGLMAVFFLYVGLELKRETVEGPFKNPKEAALPFFGAVGGMAAPALIYLAIAAPADAAYARGWAIPAATDIAFAIGVLALLGDRVPSGLRLFLLALAIIDDLGAILVIAFFYSSSLAGWALGGAATTFVIMMLLNRAGVRALTPYWILGLVLWGFMLASGVHATIAGVLTAIAIPMRRPDGRSPLVAAEHKLQPYVQLAILPLFALANAGVRLEGAGLQTLAHPIALGIAAGLVLGKPIGICAGTWAAAAVLRRPAPARPLELVGLSLIAGIGFTMSLFIGGLAFGTGDLATPVRLGVLGGSCVAALLGALLLSLAIKRAGRDKRDELDADEDVAEQRGILEER